MGDLLETIRAEISQREEQLRAAVSEHERVLDVLRRMEADAVTLTTPNPPPPATSRAQRKPPPSEARRARATKPPAAKAERRTTQQAAREYRKAIADRLQAADEPLTSRQLQEALGAPQGTIDKHLRALVAERVIQVAEQGPPRRYAAARFPGTEQHVRPRPRDRDDEPEGDQAGSATTSSPAPSSEPEPEPPAEPESPPSGPDRPRAIAGATPTAAVADLSRRVHRETARAERERGLDEPADQFTGRPRYELVGMCDARGLPVDEQDDAPALRRRLRDDVARLEALQSALRPASTGDDELDARNAKIDAEVRSDLRDSGPSTVRDIAKRIHRNQQDVLLSLQRAGAQRDQAGLYVLSAEAAAS